MLTGIMLGCNPYANEVGQDKNGSSIISAHNILANLEFLTADDLEGREATQRGEKLAALFLSSELQKYGVSPWPAAPGYLQTIDLRLIRFSEKSLFQLEDQQGNVLNSYQYGEDFVGASRYYPDLDTTAGIVFAGYGISAAEFNYDDYARVGVEGKVVIVFYGEPAIADSAYFNGPKESRYAFFGHKIINAGAHGASGIILLSQFEKTHGWSKMQAYVQKGNLQLKDDAFTAGQRSEFPAVPSISIREKSLGPLFASEKYSADSLLILLAKRQALPAFLLKKRARMSWKFNADSIRQAYNVVGLIPGTAAELRHEYVGIGAHYDHVGMAGDTVYNGADDNASGTAAILEAAGALVREHRNKRSVLVIFHTAEEKGLLGSKYMSEQADIGRSMIAYINLDMVGGGSADSIYSVGGDHISPELQELTEQVNAATVRFKFNYDLNNPNHPERIYYRSDHFNYALQGIPAIFFFDYFMKDYHTPADDLEKLNIKKIARISELTCQLALKLANHKGRLRMD